MNMAQTGPLIIREDTILEPGVYNLPQGIVIDADNITLDGGGAVLVGAGRQGRGVSVLNHTGVTVKNLGVREYYHGIYAAGCQGLTIAACQVASTAEVAPNTIFLDIWRPAQEAYGGGLLLADCQDCQVLENDLQHQMTGLQAYGCRGLVVRGNNASYCSAWGFSLYQTCASLYEDNWADYCCRYEPRGQRQGHMGADATGFLIIYASCDNIFRRNLARLGGDGFFLAGLSPRLEPVPCNHNRFEENDGSYSPNIAFEATFSAGNVYVGNFANHCNYGFWLGFSRDGILEGNQVNENVRAGIAVENGIGFQVRGNEFQQNEHGILLWSKHIPDLVAAVPENDTSRDWLVEGNTFTNNHWAIRIAANRDHGVRPYRVPEGEQPETWRRPRAHQIRRNSFTDNRIGIEVHHADGTQIAENTFAGNVAGDTLIHE
jgi:parallel beta-helix repeat protein